jgi:SAM-dependent MidA family methyltransferase
VDFGALLAAAAAVGLSADAITSQAHFLIAHGLDAVFMVGHEQAGSEAERYRLAQEVKRLTLPDQMGERFKVAVLRR